MFLNLLDDEEKKAFAELAGKMVEADGIVIGREAATLAALKAEMGITDSGSSGLGTGELAAAFKSKRSKIRSIKCINMSRKKTGHVKKN